jgi:parallel beta-helix repeat protein
MMKTVPVMALVLVTGLMLCLPVHMDAKTIAPSERLGNVEVTSSAVVEIMSPLSAGEWTEMHPASAPSPRMWNSMAYDSVSDKVILFGGHTGSDNDETWSYDFETNSWTNMNPTMRPPARHDMAFAYDIQSDRFLIFGGEGGYMRTDLWAYDYESNTWTEMHPAVTPPTSYGCRFSYDSHADRTVMFGGDDPNPPYYHNDTWTYDFDADVWTKIDTNGPGRSHYAMIYDSHSARTIIFGGETSPPTVMFNDTWAFLELVAHDPILIDGNAEFTAVNGAEAGSGAESDPYVIAGWDINASTAPGIEIRYTDAYFVVRNCYIHDGKSSYNGIQLSHCVNGILDGNNCSSNTHGICLESSSNNMLINNNCSNNQYGMSLESSSNNAISNNTGNSNEYNGILLDNGLFQEGSSKNNLSGNSFSGNTCGILLSYSASNNLIDNTCSSNHNEGIVILNSDSNILVNNTISSQCQGIHLSQCVNTTLSQNDLVDNGILIAGYMLDHFNTHSIDTTNTANGKPIYYYKNEIGIAVPAGAGQVLMTNCSGMRIENQNLSDATAGIELAFCTGTTVMNNTCSSNWYYGIYLCYSDNNSLINNTCSECSDGIYLTQSSSNIIKDNNCSNGDTGIEIWFSDNNLLSENTLNSNWYGANIMCSNNDTLVDNNCSSCYYSMQLYTSINNTLIRNDCSHSDTLGIWLCASDFNTLISNDCSDNYHYGIWFSASGGNTVIGNNCSSNRWSGLYLQQANDNVLVCNRVFGNGEYGICIFGSGNRIWNNTFSHNNGASDTYDPAHVQAYDGETNNWWNGSDGYGNYWSDWTSPDANMDGIVDNPYIIGGGGGGRDYYPLTTTPTEPIPEFGMVPFVVIVLLTAVFFTVGTRRRKAQ